jgi:hypothetical protein
VVNQIEPNAVLQSDKNQTDNRVDASATRGKIRKVFRFVAHLLEHNESDHYEVPCPKDVNHADSSAHNKRDMCAGFLHQKDHRLYFRPEDVPFGNLFAVGMFFLLSD